MFKKALFILSLCPSFAVAQSYVVYDFTHNRVLESHAPDSVQPIASVTKLMTANVFLENNTNPNCTIAITKITNECSDGLQRIIKGDACAF